MRIKISFIILLLLFASLQAGAKKGSLDNNKAIPLVITPDGLITLNVTVDDSIKAHFILDTGAGLHVISNALLRRISSEPAGRFTGFRHTGERIDMDIFRIGSLSVSGHYQDKPVVASWAMLDSFKIDGILSLKFFEHQPFTLDLKDTALYFESGKSLQVLLKKGTPTSLEVDDERSISLDAFTDLQANDSLRLQCIIDTGSPATYIDVRFMSRLGIDSTSSKVQRRTRKNSFGAFETEYISPVRLISIKGIQSSERKNLKTFFLRQMIYDGLIGMDFLIGNKLTFDIPERKLILNKSN